MSKAKAEHATEGKAGAEEGEMGEGAEAGQSEEDMMASMGFGGFGTTKVSLRFHSFPQQSRVLQELKRRIPLLQ